MLGLPWHKRQDLKIILDNFVGSLSKASRQTRHGITNCARDGHTQSAPPSTRPYLPTRGINSPFATPLRNLITKRAATEIPLSTKPDCYDDLGSANAPDEVGIIETLPNDLPDFGVWNAKQGQNNGSIGFYSSTAFVVDLAGETISYSTYATSDRRDKPNANIQPTPTGQQTAARSFRNDRLLVHPAYGFGLSSQIEAHSYSYLPYLTTDLTFGSSEVAIKLPSQYKEQPGTAYVLRSSGISGVLPDDHFMICVTTVRASDNSDLAAWVRSDQNLNSVPKASMSTPVSIPRFSHRGNELIIIKYVSSLVEKLSPVPLPPLAINFSLNNSGSETEESSDPSERK